MTGLVILSAILMSGGSGLFQGRDMSFTDHYEAGLSRLWGEETLSQLRDHVERGDIKEASITAMATRMGVLGVYQENVHKFGLVETFERMLEKWFKKELFRRSSAEAREKLLNVLRNSRVDEIVVAHIQTLCQSNSL